MPSTIKLQLIGVWFCVGFFTGAGWGARLVARRADIFAHLSAVRRVGVGFDGR